MFGFLKRLFGYKKIDLGVSVDELMIMSKKELDEYAINHFDVKLDRRKTKKRMIDDLIQELSNDE